MNMRISTIERIGFVLVIAAVAYKHGTGNWPVSIDVERTGDE